MTNAAVCINASFPKNRLLVIYLGLIATRMKDKLRNTGGPEAISMAILGRGTNTVAANYGSGYALDVMREHMEKVWT